jgi:glycine reductase
VGQPARIVHYVNQFFGGIGGEEKAHTPLEVREGPVGPGRALQQVLGGKGAVVATLICGDDYVAGGETGRPLRGTRRHSRTSCWPVLRSTPVAMASAAP